MPTRGLLILCLAAASLPGATFYVSTQGRAGWSGRLPEPNAQGTDGPLPSLSAARDAIRAWRAKQPGEACTVQLRGGTYYLSEPFVLKPEDSGVTYMAYPGERPVISGGRKIEGWTKGERSIWSAPVLLVRRFFSAREDFLCRHTCLVAALPRCELGIPPALCERAARATGADAEFRLLSNRRTQLPGQAVPAEVPRQRHPPGVGRQGRRGDCAAGLGGTPNADRECG